MNNTYIPQQANRSSNLIIFFAPTYLGFLISGVERRGGFTVLLTACCFLAIRAGNWQLLAQIYRVFEIRVRLEARNLRVRASIMIILVSCAL